ncbi:MAG: hypothetical protein IJZ17_00650 [Muribaculaceae bacterium]|nr:hypothetical protein [Muribaculaceae bacterium]
MKTKTIKLFGIIMMLVMGMSFNACSSDDDGDDDGGGGSGQKGDLVGNWYLTFAGGEGQILYTFYSGGDYKYQEWDPNGSLDELDTDYGTWKYVDGDLILTEDGDEDKSYYTVKWLGDDEIKLTDDYGDSDVYERVDFSKIPTEDDGDDESVSGSKGNIVGNWHYTEEGYETLWVVYSSGEFKLIEREVYNGIAEEYVDYGTWTYDDGELIMRYDDGDVMYCTIRWIGSNKIELTNDEGDKATMSRVSYSTLPESGNDENEYSMKDVCGLYYREDDGMDLDLYDDGYCELMSYDRYGDVSDEASGSYSIEGDELILRIKWDSSSKYVTEEWRIVSLSSKAMVLDIDGEHYTFELIVKY